MGKKGKAQGRAGQKKKAQKASRSSPWTQDSGRAKASLLYDSEDDEVPRTLFKGFSGVSPRTPSSLDPNIKLRHHTIAFVSAGRNSPAEPARTEEVEVAPVHKSPSPRPQEVKEQERFEEDVDDSNILTNIISEAAPLEAMAEMAIDEPPAQPLFVVDLVGDQSLAQGSSSNMASRQEERAASPTPSDSSVEIVFSGRGKSRPQHNPLREGRSNANIALPVRNPQTQPRPRHWVTEAQDPVPNTWAPPGTDWGKSENRRPTPPSDRQSEKWVPDPQPSITRQASVTGEGYERSAGSTSTRVPEGPIDGAHNPEIERLRADVKDRLRAKQQAKPSLPEKKGNHRGKRGRKKANTARDRSLVDSDDGMSEAAYDDYMANLAAQMDADEMQAITNTELVSGPVMLVDGQQYGDHDMLDPRSHAQDSSSEDEDDIDSSEESDRRQIGLDFDGSDSEDVGSSELEDALEYTEREQWDDEADLRARRLEAKTDEQLAKLWAKQIELGIEGDELVIDDGEYDSEQYGDIDAARAGLGSVDFGFKTKRKGKGNGFSFPNASALADSIDQYGEAGFDIMDFDRPSLRPTKKGRKGRLPPELEAMSDDDDGFKDLLADQWAKDRHTKKLKKLEREELRAEGLLGSSGKRGQADLTAKYQTGMTFAQIKEEVSVFLFETSLETRAFPPMAKYDRKRLHEVVSQLGLKSKSLGGGKNRFPVLIKTRSTNYDVDDFEHVFLAASRGTTRVLGNRGRANMAAKKARGGGGGGFSKAAVELRNGQIVGADAPEIGNTSMGHKLMEKMGWSRGTALGKDGEGRLLPVEQVMRTGKAGLG